MGSAQGADRMPWWPWAFARHWPGKMTCRTTGEALVKVLVAYVRRAVLFSVLWIVLTGGEALVAGIGAVLAASWLSVRLLPATRPIKITALLPMVPSFLWHSFLGGLDVARRALDPRMPLDPGWVEIAVDLPDGGKVALGGELSLMPGTLAAGTGKGKLLVHVLDKGQDLERMVRVEEARLKRAT